MKILELILYGCQGDEFIDTFAGQSNLQLDNAVCGDAL